MSAVSMDNPTDQKSGRDRRRGLRIAQVRPVKVFDPASSRYVGGQTQDVSASGLRIELPIGSPILPGRLVHVHVGVSAGPEGLVQRRGMMPARVVWIDRSRGGVNMTAGVQIVSHAEAISAA